MSSSNIAAKESVRLLLKGKLSPAFLLGVVTVLIVSLLLTLYSYLTTLPIPLVVAGVLVIIGGFILRYLIQIAGYHPPLA
jgi:formate-dependent nitrite reductase membrane component NrfD